MDGLEKLSIVIPTYGRQQYVLRQAKYWQGSGAQIHILDGSATPILNIDQFAANVHYHHLAEDFFTRMLHATSLIKTPYVALLGDDDLFMKSGLSEGIARLEQENELFGIVGRAVYFFFQRGKVMGNPTHEHSANYSKEVKTGIDRLHHLYHEGKIGGLAYGVYRADGWKLAVTATYGKRYSCVYVYDTFLRTMLTYYGEIEVVDALTWFCSGENPPIKNESSFNRKIDLIDWFDGIEFEQERIDFKRRLVDFLTEVRNDDRVIIKEVVESVVSTLEDRYRVKATNRTSLRKRIPSIVQRYVPRKVKDFGKDYLPASLKKILDWENFTLREVALKLEARGINYKHTELDQVVSLLQNFHK